MPLPTCARLSKRSSAIALAVAGLVATGCGGGAPPPAPPTQPVTTAAAQAPSAKGTTKADFIAPADRACRPTNPRLKPTLSRPLKLDQKPHPPAVPLDRA